MLRTPYLSFQFHTFKLILFKSFVYETLPDFLVLGRGQIKTDFFIEMEEGNVMDLTAQVLSAQESNGRPIPLTITVKDPDGRSGH